MPQPHGQQIEAKRIAAGFSRSELAALAGKSYQTIHGIERYNASTSEVTLKRIAKALRTSFDSVVAKDEGEAA